MADIKISALPVATSTASPDVLPIVQAGVTKQVDVSLLVGSASVRFVNPGGRLTTESGVPVSTTDRTSQATLFYTPFIHNNINTWSGTAWQANTFAEISLALTITSGKNYDVFVNAAADTLTLSSAWTNDTTRADALGTQDSVTVLSSDHTRLWLGTIRASGSNVTEDSGGGVTTQVGGKRFVWNSYNQVGRSISVIDTSNSWSYTSATIRQANAASGNKIEYITGNSFPVIRASVFSVANLNANSARSAKVGIGIDSTTTFSGLVQSGYLTALSTIQAPLTCNYAGAPGLGYHYISWNESGADVNCIFIGNNGGDGTQTGMIVTVQT